MPRRRLHQATNLIFHVMNRAARRMRLFDDENDYAAFLAVVEEGRRRTGIDLLAYCVMPNHFHLLAKQIQPRQLSEFMKWFQLTHAKRWRRCHDERGSGAVYQGRFQAVPIQDDSHFVVAARYVERNPVRAGLVPRAELWRWSSLAQRCGNGNEVTMTGWPIPPSADWLARVNQAEAPEEVSGLRRAIQDSQPFGGAVWANTVLGPQPVRGRPVRV